MSINGCGMCMESHERQLRKAGIAAEAIHSVARIAAVVHGVAGVLGSPSRAA